MIWQATLRSGSMIGLVRIPPNRLLIHLVHLQALIASCVGGTGMKALRRCVRPLV